MSPTVAGDAPASQGRDRKICFISQENFFLFLEEATLRVLSQRSHEKHFTNI